MPANNTDPTTGRDAATLGQLIPWPDDDTFANIPADEALDLFLGWVESRGIELWDHQAEALLDLAAGNHVILGTPTGSGKSMVALGMCFLAVCTDRRAYYTAPIKALVSEKFFELVNVLGRDNVGMITGDVAINSGAPVICCTAEILANDALRGGEHADVGCVAMDEFHFYADRDRGWAWQVPLLALPNTQFLLMSATLGDVDDIADSLEGRTGRAVDRVLDAERPVPLEYRFVDTTLEGTVELAIRNGEAPVYVVHFSQDAALKSAQALASYGVSSKEQREAIKQAIKGTRFTTGFGKTLRRLLGCGVGVQKNSACYDVQLEAGGYLMGVIVALATQSNKVGVIGGGEGSEITRGHEGFKAGAKSINPDIEIQEVYTGDWNDTTGAYEAAIGMYDAGVDVIWHSGDGIGLDVVQAAEEKDMYVLGNVEDQKSLAPNNVLSGLQYEWANALDRIFTSIQDGTFVSDGEKETYMINVANGGLSMTELNDVKGWLTEDDIAVIQDVYAKLGQDAIDLPEV